MEDESSESDSDGEKFEVKFWSEKILPSHKESCRIKFEEEEVKVFKKVDIHDFELLKALSHGAYGKVCLARKKGTQSNDEVYAIKVLDKEKVEADENELRMVMNER